MSEYRLCSGSLNFIHGFKHEKKDKIFLFSKDTDPPHLHSNLYLSLGSLSLRAPTRYCGGSFIPTTFRIQPTGRPHLASVPC